MTETVRSNKRLSCSIAATKHLLLELNALHVCVHPCGQMNFKLYLNVAAEEQTTALMKVALMRSPGDTSPLQIGLQMQFAVAEQKYKVAQN